MLISQQPLQTSTDTSPNFRARRDYWENLKTASGRPLCPSLSTPDSWGVTKGDAALMQQKEATSKDQLKQLFDRSKTH